MKILVFFIIIIFTATGVFSTAPTPTPLVNEICLLHVLCMTKMYGDMLLVTLSSFFLVRSICMDLLNLSFHYADVPLFCGILRPLH
jgi:hypothetical protein